MKLSWPDRLLRALAGRGEPLLLDPALPPVPASAAEAEAQLKAQEAALFAQIRPDNEARIQWATAPGQVAERCIVYLHGYSACWREGGPVHQATAQRFGANLLLARLSGHGLEEEEPLLHWDPELYWADAKQALAWGRALGREVILMATSSGAPLALRLAAEHPLLVSGLVLYSPNVRIHDFLAPLMSAPWGLALARLVRGSRYNEWPATPEEARYWYRRQRLEGAVQLQRLLNYAYSGDVLGRVHQPSFFGVYYQDALHQDSTISVAASRRAWEQLGSSPHKKTWAQFPLAGKHVIACDLSSQEWREVQAATWEFLETVMGWAPEGLDAVPK
jgi:pimeloyl-ACP methyl ester carboxylesterase